MKVFIAQSLDGYIAGPGNSLDHLEPFSENDYGYDAFIADARAVVMGRNTFDTVYPSQGWTFPEHLDGVIVTSRPLPDDVPKNVYASNDFNRIAEVYPNAYVDGGQTIAAFTALGAITEAKIFTLPLLLGQGTPLFPPRSYGIDQWQLHDVRAYPCGTVMKHYKIGE